MGPAVRAVLLRASCEAQRSGGLQAHLAPACRMSMDSAEDI